MLLNKQGLVMREEWEQKGYSLPRYDRETVTKKTKEAPFWIHFGAGNIFRAFQANVVQKLLNEGILEQGLIVAEGYDYEIIEKIDRMTDNYNIGVTLKSDGTVEKTVIGSIVESLTLDQSVQSEFSRLQEIFTKDSLQIVSFTITEKGYSLVDAKGELLPLVATDMEAGPKHVVSYMGKVTALLYERFLAGKKPVAMVSMDNCSHNGDKLYAAIAAFAKAWVKTGLVDADFEGYVSDKTKVSFPWTMIDKITPRPDKSVEKMLVEDGIEHIQPIITSKNTYVAPFVNAEECEYLVIEDTFPNGRPELEKGGILFTNRETVEKVEKMKVCTCLNPLHTALAVYGCLLGYDLISQEMKNDSLKKLVEVIGYKEGLPVVVDPKIIEPKKFIDEVVNIRIPNPFMPDTPQRIATDTSQKLAIRFGETIKAYLENEDKELDIENLKGIPLVFAGWLRYLMGINDQGEKFELSSDPMLESVCAYVKDIKLGDQIDAYEALRPVLSNAVIFGVDLYEVNLAKRVAMYFEEMIVKPGAVADTLKKYMER